MKRPAIVTEGKRPAFMFYTKDYMGDSALRLCSAAARGLWVDMLCLMHSGNPYGCLTVSTQQGDRPMRMKELCKITSIKPSEGRKLLAELETNNVFSWGILDSNGELREQNGEFFGTFSRKNEEKVKSFREVSNEMPEKFALGSAPEPCIFSRRMVRDFQLYLTRKEFGSAGGNPNILKHLPPNDPDDDPGNGRRNMVNPHGTPVDTPKAPQAVKDEVKSARANAFAVAFAVASASKALGSSSPGPTLQVEPQEGCAMEGQTPPSSEAQDQKQSAIEGRGVASGFLDGNLDLGCPHDAILDLYTTICTPQLPVVLRARWPEGSGHTALGHRWREGICDAKGRPTLLPDWMTYASRSEGLDAWRLFFERVMTSDLLTGKRGKWRSDLRWLVRKENFLKVVEGVYLDSAHTRRTPALSRFLAAYPRRCGDPDAVAIAWDTLGLENASERVFEGLAKWSASQQWTEDDGKFIPNAARWLNARSFDDVPPCAANKSRQVSNVHPFPARRPNNALWAEPASTSSHPRDTGDWRAIAFPGGMYFVSEDAVLTDEQIARAQSYVAPFYEHGRIVSMDPPPERVRLMIDAKRCNSSEKPRCPLRDEELPAFPPDAVLTLTEDVG
jgi:hypothetical protein